MFNLNNVIKNFFFPDDFIINDYLSILNSIKLAKRSLIVILFKNRPEYILFYIYCISNGYVLILLNETEIEELDSILKKYKPNYIFLSKSISGLFSGQIVMSNKLIELKIYSNSKIIVNDDLALLLSTSGSTSSKKFVRLSYKNLLSNAIAIKNALGIKNTDITITNLPLNYSFGLSVLNSHLISDSLIIISDYSVLQKEFWYLVNKFQVTCLYGVPYTYEILDKIRFYNMDNSHFRIMAQAGGKMEPQLQEKYLNYCAEKGIEYYTMYGQTEATARMSYLPYFNANIKKGSIGIPIPEGRFELRNELNEIINDSDVEGELVYYGTNVSLGYATCTEDLLKGDVNNGVLYTGDLAKRDNDGYFYIVARKNRFLKLFGNRISLQEIEDKLLFMGIESVCGGQDDHMIVYLTDFEKKEFVKDWLIKSTKIHSSAFEVEFCETIPRNSSGKILYNQLFKKC